MWIPNFGLMFFPDGDSKPEDGEKSKQDKTKREFTISLFLEDTNKRELQSSTLALESNYETEMMVGDSKEKIKVLFVKNSKNRLGTICYKIMATNHRDAAKAGYNTTGLILSFLSLINGTNLPIFAVKVIDNAHNYSWQARPQSHTPDKFALPKSIEIDSPFRTLISLYREGKNNPSPYYSFFCFYKILEAFYECRYVFGAVDKHIKDNKLDLRRPKRKITKEMLLYALCSRTEYEGLAFGRFFEKLRSNQRLMIAHVFPKDKPIINLDDFDLYTEFATIGNLVDQVARQILIDELDIWKKLISLKIVNPSPLPKF